MSTSQRKCVELKELEGQAITHVEWVSETFEDNTESSAVLHLTNGYVLYVDEPTAYGRS